MSSKDHLSFLKPPAPDGSGSSKMWGAMPDLTLRDLAACVIADINRVDVDVVTPEYVRQRLDALNAEFETEKAKNPSKYLPELRPIISPKP